MSQLDVQNLFSTRSHVPKSLRELRHPRSRLIETEIDNRDVASLLISRIANFLVCRPHDQGTDVPVL